jgi:hypothetical protein
VIAHAPFEAGHAGNFSAQISQAVRDLPRGPRREDLHP